MTWYNFHVWKVYFRYNVETFVEECARTGLQHPSAVGPRATPTFLTNASIFSSIKWGYWNAWWQKRSTQDSPRKNWGYSSSSPYFLAQTLTALSGHLLEMIPLSDKPWSAHLLPPSRAPKQEERAAPSWDGFCYLWVLHQPGVGRRTTVCTAVTWALPPHQNHLQLQE